MATATDHDEIVVRRAQELTGATNDYDALIDLVGDRRLVLLGESTHGTHEFYRERARITARLIDECGFNAVAVEADWPDAYRVNRYVMGQSADPDARAALLDFERFPAWMWRNADVVRFVEWLRVRNDAHSLHQSKARFYGLDLYSLRASMEAVVTYLDVVDPEAAVAARHRYGCFDQVRAEGALYGEAVARDLIGPCEKEVVAELTDLRLRAASLLARDGFLQQDEYFFAEQNARLVRNAERYYRAMYRGRELSWNLRDQHMVETLEALLAHLERSLGSAKVVVWEHNSHVGDARATEMGTRGELNVGQLVRTRHPQDCLLVGFTTSSGRVTAASDWGGPAEHKHVRPPLTESYEHVFHEAGIERFWLPMDRNSALLHGPRLERAIGVIYRPDTERASHYFQAHLAAQFDAVIHHDRTIAVEPLEPGPKWHVGEISDTYPTGL